VLDRDFRQGLSDCRRRMFVTSHAAFGHLAERYGLRMVPIAGISPDIEPSPARLAELQQVVAEAGVTTVFSETLASPRLAQTLAEEVGVETAVLDPVEGLTDSTSNEDYLSLMRANLTALQKANGCR
jgi:zinc transport system substrate-binding protein